MKKLFKAVIIAFISFLALAYFYPGFKFASSGDILLSALMFSALHIFIKRIMKILTIPLNLITFGLASLLLNVLILYLISNLIAGFSIVTFDLNIDILGFSIPSFGSSIFPSIVSAAVILGSLNSFLVWVLL